VIATDGEIGTVSRLLFRRPSWRIHICVDVEPGSKANVVLAISAVEQPDWTKRKILVRSKKEQVRDSLMSIPKSRSLASKKLRWRKTGEDGLLGIHPLGGRSFMRPEGTPCPHQRGPGISAARTYLIMRFGHRREIGA